MQNRNNFKYCKFFVFILSFLPFISYARTKTPEKNSAPRVGNFALPAAQQVFPLIAFGQNIIGKNLLQPTFYFEETLAKQNTYSATIYPQLLWGVTDNFSLLILQPISIENRQGSAYSSGLNDTTFQFEGALYDDGDATHALQLTLVGNVTAPSGSGTKNPPTGFGAPSFFIGPTFSYLDIKWYAFLSSGITLPLKRHQSQTGNQFFYQAGFGRNMPSPPKTIFDWLVEITGTYTWPDILNGINNSNSGGNIIYVTPSLFFATTKWNFQIGVGYPVVQTLNGNQPKQYFQTEAAITYTFGKA